MNSNHTNSGLKEGIPVAALAIFLALFVSCKDKLQSSRSATPSFKSDSSKIFSDTGSSLLSTHDGGTRLENVFDSIGPALTGDFNGDQIADTARAVHVRSVKVLEESSIQRETLDTTSPYEALCGGWGAFLVLSDGSTSPNRWTQLYFCGQQSRVQDFNWVSANKLDTLPYPNLKEKTGNQVSHVVSLFSQAGVPVYLYFNGDKFAIYEPEEEP